MFNKDDLYEETIEIENIFSGNVFKIKKLKVKLHDGNISNREILEHNGGACVVAITDENKIVLVEQFRKPVEKVTLELPAGKLEIGEDPLQAIKRELREETGYTPSQISYLGRIMPTPGYSNEYIYIFKATGLKHGKTDFDYGEFINIIEIPLENIKEKIINGEIEDGKTIAAIAFMNLM